MYIYLFFKHKMIFFILHISPMNSVSETFSCWCVLILPPFQMSVKNSHVYMYQNFHFGLFWWTFRLFPVFVFVFCYYILWCHHYPCTSVNYKCLVICGHICKVDYNKYGQIVEIYFFLNCILREVILPIFALIHRITKCFYFYQLDSFRLTVYLICISLIVSEVEHIYKCLKTICISFPWKLLMCVSFGGWNFSFWCAALFN